MSEPLIETTVVRVTRDFSSATYTEDTSSRPFSDPATGPDLTSVITVLEGEQTVFAADPARVLVSDAPGDCTNLLRMEYVLMGCGFTCGVYCTPVKVQ